MFINLLNKFPCSSHKGLVQHLYGNNSYTLDFICTSHLYLRIYPTNLIHLLFLSLVIVSQNIPHKKKVTNFNHGKKIMVVW